MQYTFDQITATGDQPLPERSGAEKTPTPATQSCSLLAAPGPAEFDWDDDDSIVLREQRATAVYRNRSGAVVIRQRGAGDDEDTFVFIEPENEIAFMEGMAEQLRK
jgi:hypothetical protein